MKFSIIMPTFNHASFIFEAIDSIRSQSYSNWELIIVNDGSTDDTSEILNEYSKLDARIKPFHKLNGGTVSALNYALHKATGDWLFWLSSDDLFEPNKLEEHYNYMKSNSEVNFIHTNHYLLDNSNSIKSQSNFNVPSFVSHTCNQTIRLFELNYINGVTVSFSKAAFYETGFFNYSFRAGHDFDYWLRLSLKYKIHYINKHLSSTRIHPGQDTAKSVYSGLFDSGISAFETLKNNWHLVFSFKFENEVHKIEFLNACLRVILNKNSYINFCGFENYYMAQLSCWLKNYSDTDTLGKIKSAISHDSEFKNLIIFLNSDSDLEFIERNSEPKRLIFNKYHLQDAHSKDLNSEALKYIQSKFNLDYDFLIKRL